jgi:hypothetical protein
VWELEQWLDATVGRRKLHVVRIPRAAAGHHDQRGRGARGAEEAATVHLPRRRRGRDFVDGHVRGKQLLVRFLLQALHHHVFLLLDRRRARVLVFVVVFVVAFVVAFVLVWVGVHSEALVL